jgi:hypothetical protein
MVQGLEEIREEELKLYMYIVKINIWQKVVISLDIRGVTEKFQDWFFYSESDDSTGPTIFSFSK